MSHHRHSKDKLYITYSEHQMEWGGKKQTNQHLTRLPFDCCSLSLEQFKNPVCTPDGCVFDIVNIIPYIKKYQKNPVTGQPLKMQELVQLKFHKNEKNQYHDPVSFKVFTDHTKLVAIRQSGNVFCNDTIEELNRKQKNWKDLVTGENFTFKDLIVLQDPKNIEARTVKNFDYLKQNLQNQQSEVEYVQLGESGKLILEMAKLEAVKRHTEEVRQKQVQEEELEQIKKKLKTQVENSQLTVNEFLEYAAKSGDYVSERYATEHDSVSVTSTHMVLRNKPLGEITYRNMTVEEVRKVLYDRIRKSAQKGYVQLITNYGNINFELHCDMVPMTCHNFLELCEKGYYNKTKFHKIIQNEMIEGGDPTATGYGGESIFGKPFKLELNNLLTHSKAGIISMGNLGPTHQTSQFFITLAECKKYDGKNAVFGEVVGGFQNLYNINKIEANMWQRPENTIKIKEVKMIKNPFRDMIKVMMSEKEADKDEKLIRLKKAKDNERWIDDEKFEIPKETTTTQKKGLGLATQLIQQFSNQEQIKKINRQYTFDSWI